MTVKMRVSADRADWITISGLPYEDGSGFDKKQRLREWAGSSIVVKYEHGTWSIAPVHFMPVAIGLAERYGAVTLARERRVQDRCTDGCQNANADTASECECVCLGMEHGGGYAGRRWKQVGDHLLVAASTIERTTYVLDAKNAEKLRARLA